MELGYWRIFCIEVQIWKYKLSVFVNFASVCYQSQYFEMPHLIKPIQ